MDVGRVEGGLLVIDRKDGPGCDLDRGGVAEVVVAVVVAQDDLLARVPGDAVGTQGGAFAERRPTISVGAEEATVAQYGEVRRESEKRGAERCRPGQAVVVGVTLPQMQVGPAVVVLLGRVTDHDDDPAGRQLGDMGFAEIVGCGGGAAHLGGLGPGSYWRGRGEDADVTAVVAVGCGKECVVPQGDAAVDAVGSGHRSRPGATVVVGNDDPAAMARSLGAVGGGVDLLDPGLDELRRVGVEGQAGEVLGLPKGGPHMHRDAAVGHQGQAALAVVDRCVVRHDRIRPGCAIVFRAHRDDRAVRVHVMFGADKGQQQVAVRGTDQRRPGTVIGGVAEYGGMADDQAVRGHGANGRRRSVSAGLIMVAVAGVGLLLPTPFLLLLLRIGRLHAAIDRVDDADQEEEDHYDDSEVHVGTMTAIAGRMQPRGGLGAFIVAAPGAAPTLTGSPDEDLFHGYLRNGHG